MKEDQILLSNLKINCVEWDCIYLHLDEEYMGWLELDLLETDLNFEIHSVYASCSLKNISNITYLKTNHWQGISYHSLVFWQTWDLIWLVPEILGLIDSANY